MKCVSQPTSHNCPIVSNDLEASFLKMCSLVTSSGKSGIFMLQVCEDCMVALFSRSTCMPISGGFMFVTSIVL